MILGITGTRKGFTNSQYNAFKTTLQLLLKDNNVEKFLQGQCQGVDVQAGDLVHKVTRGKVLIQSHPPIKQELIGECHVDIKVQPKNYLARDRDIADQSDILFACPAEEEPQEKGGTWYTYKYALSKGYKVILITPSGKITKINFDD